MTHQTILSWGEGAGKIWSFDCLLVKTLGRVRFLNRFVHDCRTLNGRQGIIWFSKGNYYPYNTLKKAKHLQNGKTFVVIKKVRVIL